MASRLDTFSGAVDPGLDYDKRSTFDQIEVLVLIGWLERGWLERQREEQAG